MKHFKKSILTIAILATISSCSTDKQNNKTENPLKVYNIETTRFSINADHDTTLICPKGTVLSIYENTFVDASGNKPTGQVDIEIKEVLTNEDILLANLYTLSNGQLLESGGMIYINATANAKQLEFADGQSIGVVIQQNKRLTNMQVFSGEIDTLTGQINWIEPRQILDNDFVLATDITPGVLKDTIWWDSSLVDTAIVVDQNLSP